MAATKWLDRVREQIQPQLDQWAIHFSAVKLTLPRRSWFKFPPANLPATLPVPTESPNYNLPFTIPTEWYNAALSPAVPITFALVYATLITFLNAVNRRRNHKPWAISQTSLFKVFVISHNVFLSLYSLWTFIGMWNALSLSIANPREHGLVGMVDSLCKINGPRGYGSAATYNETTNTWGITDRAYRLGKDGLTPDSTDVGRLWNEGLAFYGWLFYISKFYEVVDTLIIIAKGKKSSFLQTYHHAGAMMCMWAGIRYMSPPIWMFAFENSFIHFIMYAFYTSTTIGIRVPKWMKQILTTLQITQFVVGITFAFGHYFIAYQIPVSVSYVHYIGEAVREATDSIKLDASSALSQATATASADAGAWLKKLALRAAGREGLAENVENQLGQKFGIDAVHAIEDFVYREETRYRNDFQWVHCLDTSGQTFAIYLNLFYLVPLTGLFVQFFIKSYLRRADQHRRSSVGQRAYIARQSIIDARKGVGRRLSETFEDWQGQNGDLNGDDQDGQVRLLADGADVRKNLREMANNIQHKAEEAISNVGQKVSDLSAQDVTAQAQEMAKEIKDEVEKAAQKVSEFTQPATSGKGTDEETPTKGSNITESAKKSVESLLHEDTTSNAADTAEKVKEEAEALAESAERKAQEVIDKGKDTADQAKEAVEEKAADTDAKAVEQPTVEEAKGEAESTATKPETPTGNENASGEEHGEDASLVQEGKSFAAAAAEGMPEEAEGEHTVLELEDDGVHVKKEDLDDEGKTETGPGSLTRQLSDAMSTHLSDSPQSQLSRSRSSTQNQSQGTSPISTPSRMQWHSKRRGKSWSGDPYGHSEPAVASSPVNVGRHQNTDTS